MSAQRRIQVVIHGRTYQVAGADPEHTRSLARKVDEAMRRSSDAAPGADNYQTAILASLLLADELAAARKELREFRSLASASAGRILDTIDGALASPGAAERDADPQRAERTGTEQQRDGT